MPTPKLPQETINLMREMKMQGKSNRKIAKKLGVGTGTVSKYTSKHEDGYEHRPSKVYELYDGESNESLRQRIADDQGCNVSEVNVAWIKSNDGDGNGSSIQIKFGNIEEENKMREMSDALIESIKNIAPIYPVLTREKLDDPCILVLMASDIHIGKLCEMIVSNDEYNVDIACERVLGGIEQILIQAKTRNIEKIVFAGGNDVLHTDHNKKATTSGTPQDTQGSRFSNFRIAKQLYYKVIDTLLTVANVHYVHIPSNHDKVNGTLLSEVVEAYYTNNKNITFEVGPKERKYIQYGASLIGLEHGESKPEKLVDDMKSEAKEARACSDHGYWYLSHLHHRGKMVIKSGENIKLEKDHMDICVNYMGERRNPKDKCYVEYMRSVSGTDQRHHKNSYHLAPKCISGYIHDYNLGQVARFDGFF